MGAWFWVYVTSTLGASALLLRSLAPGAAALVHEPRIRAALVWSTLSALTGLLVWTVLACTVGVLLQGQGLLELRFLGACLLTSAYFAGFVILLLAPGYILAYCLYVKYAPRFAPVRPSRTWLAGLALALALPGTLAVVASFAGVSEVTSAWRWPEALRVLPVALPAFWAATYVPRRLVSALRPELIEGAEVQHLASMAAAV